jgi:hypothetical protein
MMMDNHPQPRSLSLLEMRINILQIQQHAWPECTTNIAQKLQLVRRHTLPLHCLQGCHNRCCILATKKSCENNIASSRFLCFATVPKRPDFPQVWLLECTLKEWNDVTGTQATCMKCSPKHLLCIHKLCIQCDLVKRHLP